MKASVGINVVKGVNMLSKLTSSVARRWYKASGLVIGGTAVLTACVGNAPHMYWN
jgi:hypothetical protein